MRQPDFEALVSRLRPAIYRTAITMTRDADTADDIAQDTLLRLWQLRDRLDGYRSVDALAGVIARNLAIDHLRGRGVVVSLSEVDVELPDMPGNAPDDVMISAEFAAEVDRVMSQLAPAQQAVMRMRHSEGLETEEIARIIGTTPANVRVLLCRTRARVKSLFVK